MAVMEPPYTEPQKTPSSIKMPYRPSRENVKGIRMVMAMMEDRPGIAPQRMPNRAPRKITAIPWGVQTICRAGRIYSICQSPFSVK